MTSPHPHRRHAPRHARESWIKQGWNHVSAGIGRVALHSRANVHGNQAVMLERRADRLETRADALNQRIGSITVRGIVSQLLKGRAGERATNHRKDLHNAAGPYGMVFVPVVERDGRGKPVVRDSNGNRVDIYDPYKTFVPSGSIKAQGYVPVRSGVAAQRPPSAFGNIRRRTRVIRDVMTGNLDPDELRLAWANAGISEPAKREAEHLAHFRGRGRYRTPVTLGLRHLSMRRAERAAAKHPGAEELTRRHDKRLAARRDRKENQATELRKRAQDRENQANNLRARARARRKP